MIVIQWFLLAKILGLSLLTIGTIWALVQKHHKTAIAGSILIMIVVVLQPVKHDFTGTQDVNAKRVQMQDQMHSTDALPPLVHTETRSFADAMAKEQARSNAANKKIQDSL